uniref:Ankyrin-like protein n=1 Tax=Strongyloides venezuelensis TaxID=75913 RepID=A0A0K0F4V7_STRVS
MMPKKCWSVAIDTCTYNYDATAKMIMKYMLNNKLLDIKCFFYKESDALGNFTILECLISSDYCPIRIPMTLKVLAFRYQMRNIILNDLDFIDDVIKLHYKKFTKHITNNVG